MNTLNTKNIFFLLVFTVFSFALYGQVNIEERFRIEPDTDISFEVDTSAVSGIFNRLFILRGNIGFSNANNSTVTHISTDRRDLGIDTLIVLICDDNDNFANTDNIIGCDTVYYEVTIARNQTSQSKDWGAVEILTEIEECLPLSSLPFNSGQTKEFDIRLSDRSFEDFGATFTVNDSCFTFKADSVPDSDQLEVLFCNFVVCDTFKYTISTQQFGSFQATIDTVIAQEDAMEICYDIQNKDAFQINLLSPAINDNGSSYVVNDTCFTYQTGLEEEMDTIRVEVRDRFEYDTFQYNVTTQRLGELQLDTTINLSLCGNFSQNFEIENSDLFEIKIIEGGVADNRTVFEIDGSRINYESSDLIDMDTFTLLVRDGFVFDTFQYIVNTAGVGGVDILPMLTVQLGERIENCIEISNPNDYGVIPLDSSYSDANTDFLLEDSCYTYEAGVILDIDTLRFGRRVGCLTDTIIQIINVISDTIDLPVEDDFSYDSELPTADVWIGKSVYVNRSFGYNAPNVGVATMDGLDDDGNPYGSIFGESDMLITKPIDLSSVPVSATDTLYLSFEAQPKGLGEAPEDEDFLVLEFKDTANVWIGIDTIMLSDFVFDMPISNLEQTASFQKFNYPVIDSAYLYDNFQFQLVNYSSNKGAVDIWNIDAVNLSLASANSPSFFIAEPIDFSRHLMSRYTTMPRNQFESNIANEIEEQLFVEMFNYDTINATSFVLLGSAFLVTIKNTDELVGIKETFVGSEFVVEPNESDILNFSNKSDNDFRELLNDTRNDETVDVEVELSYLNGKTPDTLRFSNRIFAPYFAYDDGTAESNLAARGGGVKIAVEYETNIADTLRNIQMLIQHANDTPDDIQIRLCVWRDSLQTEPVFESKIFNPVFANEFGLGVQGFTTYALINENDSAVVIPMPAGKFFIGWEQITKEIDNAMAVGMDRNTTKGEGKIFAKLTDTWNPIASENFPGSLMLRPVFGTTTQVATPIDDIYAVENSNYILYPNPSEDYIYLKEKSENKSTLLDYEVYNSLGQLQFFGNFNERISINMLNKGIYFLKLTSRTDARSVEVIPFIKK